MKRNELRSIITALVVAALLIWQPQALLAASQAGPSAGDLPPVLIDALDGDQWSVREVRAAPGQRIIVTNRDVDRHGFTIVEWSIDVQLRTLEPVELLVPENAEPGSSVVFYSDFGDDRRRGLEGTIVVVTPEQIIAELNHQETVSATVANRIVVEIRDPFVYHPSELQVYPGALIEIRNVGTLEHHFVVDEWAVNQTIVPGEIKLVQVPADAMVGETLIFYCSIPGHRPMGMEGTITILSPPTGVSTLDPDRPDREVPDLRPFIPDSDVVGAEWTHIRTGPASSVISGRVDFNLDVFPGEGLGAAYLGPGGSRIVIVVMPLQFDAVPANQVRDAIQTVQASMMQSWETDRLSSAAQQRIPPPRGCDVAIRASGVVPAVTMPAGSTVCELREAGVAIFVAVEGDIDGASGVQGADRLIARLLSAGAAG